MLGRRRDGKLGCNKAELEAVNISLETLSKIEAESLDTTLSEIPEGGPSKDAFMAVLITAAIESGLNDIDFYADITMRIAKKRNGTRFTMNVLRWASRDTTLLLHLEPLAAQFVSSAELAMIKEMFEFLSSELSWGSQIILRLMDRITKEKNIAWALPMLHNLLLFGRFERPEFEREAVGDSLVDLAANFSEQRSGGVLSRFSFQLVTARIWRITEFEAHHQSPLFSCLVIVEATDTLLNYWIISEEAQQMRTEGIVLEPLIDELLETGSYKRFEELSLEEQTSCNLVLDSGMWL